jgi:hypothetical protein
MTADLEAALNELDLRYRFFGPLAVLTFDSGLPSYELSLPVDLRVSDGYLVGRAFLFGPVLQEKGETTARYVAFASAQLVGAKLVMVDSNVLVQAEEPLRSNMGEVVHEIIRRLLSAARVVALEVVSVATDPAVHQMVLDLLGTSDTSSLPVEEGAEAEALAELAGGPANQANVALSRRDHRAEQDYGDASQAIVVVQQQSWTD